MKSETEQKYKTYLKDTMKLIAKKSKRLNPHDEKINEVFYHYEKYKEIIQKNMKKKDVILTEEDFMDHHKIAALLCCSVLKVKPIEIIMKNSGKELNFIEKYSNEMCAYLLGLQAIQGFWNKKRNENKKSPVMTPKPSDNNNTYIDWFAKLIREETFKHLDYENSLFEVTMIFFISHIYFMIESYSFKYYKS